MKKLDTPQIALPFDVLADGSVDEVEQDTLDEIGMSIETILRYPLDFRASLPDFGTPDLSFREDAEGAASTMLEYVSRWEDRVQLFAEYRPDDWDAMVRSYVLTAQADRST